MNFTIYPGFFSDYYIRASKSYMESRQLFHLYFMLFPEECLHGAEERSQDRLRMGKRMPPRQELLQGAPLRTLGQGADLPPSGHTRSDPAAGSPLPPAAKGSTHLSAHPQPT